jgi:hypothetical protein
MRQALLSYLSPHPTTKTRVKTLCLSAPRRFWNVRLSGVLGAIQEELQRDGVALLVWLCQPAYLSASNLRERNFH